MGVPGPELTEGLVGLIKEIQPGGFILFARNLASPEQTYRLVSELYSLCNIPPVITLDQEGGRVARLKAFAGVPVSGYELARAGSAEWASEHGRLTAALLRLFGFNLNLAPVIDYSLSEERDNSLRGRCLGTSPDQVIELASAFLDAMESGGVLGTVKHFPGYTYCENDPHGALPIIQRSLEEMNRDELRVFRTFLKRASSVMIGHGHFTHWHSEPFPASLSPSIVGGLLRHDMGYQGLVMTDDLEMGAITRRFGAAESARMAVEAGNDMLLICHNPACAFLASEALSALPGNIVEPVLQRIQNFKARLAPPPSVWNPEHFAHLVRETAGLKTTVYEHLHSGSHP